MKDVRVKFHAWKEQQHNHCFILSKRPKPKHKCVTFFANEFMSRQDFKIMLLIIIRMTKQFRVYFTYKSEHFVCVMSKKWQIR